MKILSSIFFIILSLSTEVVALHGLHTCEWVKSEICSSESLEGCETRMPVNKSGNFLKKERPSRPLLSTSIYRATEPGINSINQLCLQHRFRKNASPVYLSNRVFLI
jgi:hypothetical protein